MSAYTDQASASPTPAWFDRLQSTIRWLVYPVLLGGAMALLWALLALGASLAWAPYLAVAILGPLVVLAERALPYRPGWQASRSDLVDDGLYLLVVQIALPLALVWTVVRSSATPSFCSTYGRVTGRSGRSS